MIDISAVFAEFNGASFPDFTGKNATGAGATDGTEFIAAMIDNWMWGPTQALLDYMGLTPNGVTESASASQVLDALNMFLPVGCPIEWNRANDPATDGLRFLLLNGQGVLRANYPDLDAAVYVGDGNNAAVAAAGGAYYHADDAAGTTPNTAGVYLILPESRGYTTRGLDSAASVDPDGASRYIGDNQLDAMQRITGEFYDTPSGVGTGLSDASAIFDGVFVAGTALDRFRDPGVGASKAIAFDNNASTSPNPAKTDDVENRMANRSTQFAVRY